MLKNVILDILKLTRKPLNAKDINTELLNKGKKPNQTSIYRALERLEQENLILKINVNDSTAYYEEVKKKHHHLRCLNCNEIECVFDRNLDTEIEKSLLNLSNQGMKVFNYLINFDGLCIKCNN